MRPVKIITINKRKGNSTIRCPIHPGEICGTHSLTVRKIKDFDVDKPVILEILCRKYFCPACDKRFTQDLTQYAKKGSRFSWKVMHLAKELRKSMTLERSSKEIFERTGIRVPPTTLHDWDTTVFPFLKGDTDDS